MVSVTDVTQGNIDWFEENMGSSVQPVDRVALFLVDGVYMFGFVALPAHPFFPEFDTDKSAQTGSIYDWLKGRNWMATANQKWRHKCREMPQSGTRAFET